MAHSLPHELSDRVIDFLHDDPVALSACALTCQSWLPAARYHRWAWTYICGWKIQQFSAILGASPGLAASVTSLDLRSTNALVIREFRTSVVNSILEHLPFLEHLCLRSWRLSDGSASILTANEKYRTLKGLSLVSCYIPSLDTMALLLTAPRLSTISLTDTMIEPTSPWEPTLPPPTPHTLCLTGLCTPGVAPLLTWLLEGTNAKVEHFLTCIRSEEEAVAIAIALASLGGHLSDLALTIDADSSLQGQQ